MNFGREIFFNHTVFPCALRGVQGTCCCAGGPARYSNPSPLFSESAGDINCWSRRYSSTWIVWVRWSWWGALDPSLWGRCRAGCRRRQRWACRDRRDHRMSRRHTPEEGGRTVRSAAGPVSTETTRVCSAYGIHYWNLKLNKAQFKHIFKICYAFRPELT